MTIYIFTDKEPALKPFFPKKTLFLGTAIFKHNPEGADISYFDISGITPDDIRKHLARFKKCCNGTPWGIIDPKGIIRDPSPLFFEGASDYLGPGFFMRNKAIDASRVKSATRWRFTLSENTDARSVEKSPGASGFPKTGIKLPQAALFPGWTKMRIGKTMPFYLLYCAVQGSTSLAGRLGETAYRQFHQRLLAYLFQNFQGADGLVWMDSGTDVLFLIPPKAKAGEIIVEACIKMLVYTPLIMLETFRLNIPVNLVFALHYGETSYSPPGKTGTVVSDAVNHVFHLGTKKAEVKRLTVTGELPDGSIPKALEDCFISAGEYEGRKIWHTKKFTYVPE